MALPRVLLVATGSAPICTELRLEQCATEAAALAHLDEEGGSIELVVIEAPASERAALLATFRDHDAQAEVAFAVPAGERATSFGLLAKGACALLELPINPLELEAVTTQAASRRNQRRISEMDAATVAALEASEPASAVPALLDAWHRALSFDSALLFVFDPLQGNRLRLVESRAIRSTPPELPWLEDFLGANHSPQILESVAPHLPPVPARESPLLVVPIRLAQHAVGALVATRTTPLFSEVDLARLPPLLSSSRLVLGVPQIQQTLVMSDRLARLGQLTASVGHELRSPLSYVSDNARFLVDQLGQLARRAEAQNDERSASVLREMFRSAEDTLDGSRRMAELLRDVSGFASADEVTVVPLDLNECIRAAVRITRAEVRHRAQVISRLDGELPVIGNLPRLSQIFVNLIVNAAHALGSKKDHDGHIVILSRREGDRLIVEVSDNGPGIPAAVMPRIFDAFFTTKTPGEGTGLGLFLCRDIARQHGGTLHARSSPTRGATFTLELPVASPREEALPSNVVRLNSAS